jgi:NAD(P)-dependent dehydrogenase (short-subunit alcohol dehydrogenase family)
LINCAGVIIERAGGSPLETPADQVLGTLDINAVGAYRMTQAFLPGMNARGFGRVVNVSSGMGALRDMGSGTPGYRISKAALSAVTVQMSHAAGKNVKVNAVCPGWVRTDMGGKGATRAIPEGVSSIVWGALLEPSGPTGGFFRDGKPISW